MCLLDGLNGDFRYRDLAFGNFDNNLNPRVLAQNMN